LGHAIEGGEVEEEPDEPSKGILDGVVHGVKGFGSQECSEFSIHHTDGEQEESAEHIIVKDHAEFGELDGFCGKFEVEDVSARAKAVGQHPKQPCLRDIGVVLRRHDGPRQHDSKGGHDQPFDGGAIENAISDCRHDVGDVFEDGDHGHGVVFETGHSGEEHSAEEEVDGRPELGGAHVESGVVDPAHLFGEFHANDGGDGLEDDQEDVQVALDQVVVARRQTLIDQHHADTATTVHGTGNDTLHRVATTGIARTTRTQRPTRRFRAICIVDDERRQFDYIGVFGLQHSSPAGDVAIGGSEFYIFKVAAVLLLTRLGGGADGHSGGGHGVADGHCGK